MGVGLQACGREHVLDLFGHAVHVRRGGGAAPVVPHHPKVDIRGWNGLPAAVASKGEPRKLGRRRPGRLHGELDHPSHQGLDYHRDDRADLPGAQAAVMQRDHGGIEAGCRVAQLLGVLRVGDRPSHHEWRPRLGGQQVQVGDHAEHLVGRRENRKVADAVIEHREHQLVRRLVGARGEDRGAQHVTHGSVRGEALGHDPGAQVVVGQDPELTLLELDQHRTRAGFDHAARRFTQRHARLTDHRLLADQSPRRLLRSVDPPDL